MRARTTSEVYGCECYRYQTAIVRKPRKWGRQTNSRPMGATKTMWCPICKRVKPFTRIG